MLSKAVAVTFLVLSILTLVPQVLSTDSLSNECVVDADGSCVDSTVPAASTVPGSGPVLPVVGFDDGCLDTADKCQEWADRGECVANPKYMLYQCKKSCQTCALGRHELRLLADQNLRLHAVGGDERLLETPYGITQNTEGMDPKLVKQIETKMARYIDGTVQKDNKYADVKDKCKNQRPDCIQLKAQDKCSAVIELKCAPVCETCEKLDFKYRCPVDRTIPPVLQPGDLNSLFDRIVTEEQWKQYKPKILSMPATNPATNTSILVSENNRIIPDGPWLVVLEQFITPDECQHLQDMAHSMGFQLSADVGGKDLEGRIISTYSSGRTSTNAWCYPGRGCAENEIVLNITRRMEQLTGIPQENYEYLQLLRYEPGQHYGRHHDFADYHLDRQFGPRVLTIFLYLNTVEEGGGTDFPILNITVQPKVGQAVIWPSVLNDRPKERDPRTDHAALPVVAGIKYGANAWIHQNDFRAAFKGGCV